MAVSKCLELSTGVLMPTIGLGTWQAQDPDKLEEALNVALECGYRHIDTAYVYHNEEVIGKVLQNWLSNGKIKREDLFITTKLPMQGIHPDRVEMFLDKSLKNLQLDYVDLYLSHFPVCVEYQEENDYPVDENGHVRTEPTDHIAVWKKMEEQVEAGKTKTIGLSNFSVKQIDNILQSCQIKPANLQVEIHVYLQQEELVEYCKDKKISVVAYSPLGSPGFNKFCETSGLPTKELPDVMGDPEIIKISEKHKKTPAQVLLRFLLQRGLAPIPKSVTPSRIKENFDVYDFELDQAEMETLQGLEKGENARVCDFLLFKGLSEHPEFPMSTSK